MPAPTIAEIIEDMSQLRRRLLKCTLMLLVILMILTICLNSFLLCVLIEEDRVKLQKNMNILINEIAEDQVELRKNTNEMAQIWNKFME